MIKSVASSAESVVSSAARLSLAPARLAGRMAGSLVRELRGDGALRTRTRRPSSARAKPASRSRATAQPKRAASRNRAKAAQPKRAASPTRAKAEPQRAASRSRAKTQPKPAPRPKPLDDVTIARKVESTIFRGVEVGKGAVNVNVVGGVAWLRGEVPTPDVINELEARTTRVTGIRRVENLLQLPKAPAPSQTEATVRQPEARPSAARPEDRAPESAAGSPEGDRSAEEDERQVPEPDRDPARGPSDPSLRDREGG